MLVCATDANNGQEKDFSFVKKEIKNIKDIPRDFDEKLYKKFDISDTVLSYWKEIGYTPSYYVLFTLLQGKQWDLLFDDYMAELESLVDKICLENEKLGEAVKEFWELQKNGYEWFISSSPELVYILSYSYDDGSGDNLICTWDYEAIMKALRKEVEAEDKDVTFSVTRYPVIYSSEGQFQGIDFEAFKGEFTFDKSGNLMRIRNIEGLHYVSMCEFELTTPYIFIPHPFVKGDIVSYKIHENTYYGVVSHSIDESFETEFEAKKISFDGSDFVIRVETIYELNEKPTMGYDHLCPLYLDKYTEEIEFNRGDELSALRVASEILKGESDCLYDLFYFMGI